MASVQILDATPRILETTPESIPATVGEDVQAILKSAREESEPLHDEASFYSLDQSISASKPNQRE